MVNLYTDYYTKRTRKWTCCQLIFLPLQKGGLIWYTDGCLCGMKVRAEIYGDRPRAAIRPSFCQHNIMYQVVILATLTCVQRIPAWTSRVCRRTLDCDYNRVNLVCVPTHIWNLNLCLNLFSCQSQNQELCTEFWNKYASNRMTYMNIIKNNGTLFNLTSKRTVGPDDVIKFE